MLNLFGPVKETRTGADISPCGLYRFCLWRHWNNDLPPALFCGLNPSTADATKDDPTIRRCVGFAKDWGFGGLVMVNLFAFRSTDPEALRGRDLREEVAELDQNAQHLRQALLGAGVCVAAWGCHALADQRCLGLGLRLADLGRVWKCLGKTKNGSPRHPLYVPKTTPLEDWP